MDTACVAVSFLLGYCLFIVILFQTDDPRFWNDQQTDIDSFSSVRTSEYNRETNTFNISIYNGNWNELMFQKEKCMDLIESYGGLEKADSFFFVTVICCNARSNCSETHSGKAIFIPFNTTQTGIIIDSPFSSEERNVFCSMRLFSNMIAQKEDGCFLSLRTPLSDRNFNINSWSWY
jgi:hypothetical protein